MRTFIVLFSLLFACSTESNVPSAQETQTPVIEASKKTTEPEQNDFFGEKFSKDQPVEVATLGENADPYLGKTVQISGKISEVCQKKGCWMELTDNEANSRVRVMVKDYTFAIPKDMAGKQAIAHGVLSSIDVDAAEAAHLAEDAGKPAPEGPVKELRLEATGVMLNEG